MTPEALRADLEQTVATWAYLGHPALLERFVLRNGVAHTAAKRPKGLRKQRDRECFNNAGWLALTDESLTYCEGMAASHLVGMPVHHAWCRDKDGRVIDPTWKFPEKAAYLGVEFSTEELRHRVNKQGYWGLLSAEMMINHELIFEHDPELKSVVEAVRAKERVK